MDREERGLESCVIDAAMCSGYDEKLSDFRGTNSRPPTLGRQKCSGYTRGAKKMSWCMMMLQRRQDSLILFLDVAQMIR